MLTNRPGLLILPLVLCLCSGCAFLSRDNRRLMNASDRMVEDTFITNSTPAEIAFSPIFLVEGAAAFAGDVVVVQPLCAFAPAGRDTYDWLWANPQGDEFSQLIKFAPKLIATPIVFTSDWLFRCLFVADSSQL